MTDSVTYDQNNMVGGGEVMEVMMTGGDGGEMNEDTLAQVVNMLQVEGQLTGGNHTIIIRQPGSSEIQMIQTTSNGGELIVSKASEADIQALQAGNGMLENVGQEGLENQQDQVVMMDEGGRLVEGVLHMQDGQGSTSEVMQLTQDGQLQAVNNEQSSNLIEVPKSTDDVVQNSEILDSLARIDSDGTQSLIDSALHSADPSPTLSTKPITISTTTSRPRPRTSQGINGEVVSIKINTGLSRKKENKPPRISPKNVIKISTITGQQKYQPPKFHKCEACAINFVSKVAYMNHMENCPSKRKTLSAVNNKGNITYTCVFCDTKFTSRLVLMQHVRTCDKAKSSKNLSGNSKLKVTTSESKLKLVSSVSLPKSSKSSLLESGKKGKVIGSPLGFKENKGRLLGRKKTSILDPDDEPFVEDKEDLDSDEEDEKNIVYDDEEDINEEDLMDDDNIEETIANKRSQKHLGPIIVKGMFKCRDCNRTFSKEYQYNRHVKACTNAPLNSSRIDADSGGDPPLNTIPVSASEAIPMLIGGKRKRGRPPSKDYANEEGRSPAKKRALGPKIISVNPKKFTSNRGRPKFSTTFSDNESDEEIRNYLTGGSSRAKDEVHGKNSKLSSKPLKKPKNDFLAGNSSSLSKIVKINPSDTLIKQTGKAMLSKINREKYSKETPFCGLCGDKFKSTQELSLHTQICHSEDLLNLRDTLDGKGNLSCLKCPLCDLHFMSSHVLLLHMVSFHEKDLKLVQEELENQNLNLICPFCNELSLTQDLLKEHLSIRHLDKLINKPSSTMSPMAIDVHAFIKEKNNGSILPTGKLLAKKERVLCPECGLFFFKSYFEHHRCAAETYSLSARRFICSESQCSGLSFYKLIHLLTHLQQVHEKSLACESLSFDSFAQFLEWLKKEESQTKMKFTKALQRMKQGKLMTVWICHRFHNAMKDPTSVTGSSDVKFETDRLNQCYSRIHTETSYNTSTSRYDGKTIIKYYPNHRHPNESSEQKMEAPLVAPVPAAPLPDKQSSLLQSFSAEEVRLDPLQSAFSNAAELKQLLEDDEDFERTKMKVADSSFDAHQLARFEDLEKQAEEAAAAAAAAAGLAPSVSAPNAGVNTGVESLFKEKFAPKEESCSALNARGEFPSATSALGMGQGIGARGENITEKIISEEESLPSSEMSGEKLDHKESKVPSLVALSDTDLLLEKMLGEHDGESSSVVAMETEQEEPSHESVGVGSLGNLAPTVAKITDVDMLEAFGGCITPEESSNPSTVSLTQQNSVSTEEPESEMRTEIDQEQESEPELDRATRLEGELHQEQSLESNLGQEHSMESNLGQEQSLESNLGQEHSMESNLGQEQSLESNLGQEQSLESNLGQEQLLESNLGQGQSMESNLGQEQLLESNLGQEQSMESNLAQEPVLEPEQASIEPVCDLDQRTDQEPSPSDPDTLGEAKPEAAEAEADPEILPESSGEEGSKENPEVESAPVPEVGMEEHTLEQEEVHQEGLEEVVVGQLQGVEEDDEELERNEEEDDDEDGDSTYVLPAGIEEWNKLFELVSSQISSNSISEEDIEEAKSLLSFEDKIMSVQMEKQIEVFNRLCALANVQMT